MDALLSHWHTVALRRFIQLRMTDSDAQRSRMHFFSSFFMQQIGVGVDFERVKRWTKSINIFEMDFLFFPIHEKCVYWRPHDGSYCVGVGEQQY